MPQRQPFAELLQQTCPLVAEHAADPVDEPRDARPLLDEHAQLNPMPAGASKHVQVGFDMQVHWPLSGNAASEQHSDPVWPAPPPQGVPSYSALAELVPSPSLVQVHAFGSVEESDEHVTVTETEPPGMDEPLEPAWPEPTWSEPACPEPPGPFGAPTDGEGCKSLQASAAAFSFSQPDTRCGLPPSQMYVAVVLHA
jgi:hypothetical protein